MNQSFNKKTGMIEITEEYEGELEFAIVPPESVDPSAVIYYVIHREVGEETEMFSGEYSDDGTPAMYPDLEDAKGALAEMAPDAGWEIGAMVWADDIDGEEDSAEDPASAELSEPA